MELLAHQVAHVGRLHNILDTYRFALDTSKMGLGKTYVACKIAADRGLKLCVICPVTLIAKWRQVGREWGLEVTTLSYASMRGKGEGPVAGNWLYRSGKVFTARPPFLALAAEGCLLVADEAQGLKNTSDQARAFAALCEPIKSGPQTASRILLLSATPFDKQVHVMNILHIAMVARARDMYHYLKDSFGMGVVILTGASEVVAACRRHDPETTDWLMRTMPRTTAAHIPRLVYSLFVDVLQQHVSTYMVPPEECRMAPLVRSAFYHLDGAQLEQYIAGVSQLHRSITHLEEGGEPPDWRGITCGLQSIELAKCAAIAARAQECLAAAPSNKVVIGLNYHAPIAQVAAALRADYPDLLLLTGHLKQEARAPVIDKFQAADARHRVIICNMAVMEVGIDLDDKDGHFPRTCLYSPHYRATGLHQAIGRVYRTDTRSQAEVHIVYGPKEFAERSVLSALTRKTKILKETLPGQVADGTVFPGDYAAQEQDAAGVFREGPAAPGEEEAAEKKKKTADTQGTAEEGESSCKRQRVETGLETAVGPSGERT